MKALLLHLGLIATFTAATSTARAAEPPAPVRNVPAAEMERELSRQIDKFVTYPLLRRSNMDGDVFVTFVVDVEGKVKVMSATSKNNELCEYVLRMLNKVDIGDNPTGTWRTTRMRFSFRPEV